MKKYLSPKEAYVDYLIGELPENPLDQQGRLLEAYDGNEYVELSWEEYFDKIDKYYERLHAGYTYPGAEEDDPDYNHPYDDEEYLDESYDDYEEDEEEDSESDYLNEDLWDDGDGWSHDDEMEEIDE